MFHCLVAVCTGDQASGVFDGAGERDQPLKVVSGLQSLDVTNGPGWHRSLVPSVVEIVINCVCN